MFASFPCDTAVGTIVDEFDDRLRKHTSVTYNLRTKKYGKFKRKTSMSSTLDTWPLFPFINFPFISLLLDAILASPPPPTNSNPKHYQSSHPPQSMVPSQGYAQTQYQSHPPPGAVHPYRPRPDHSDHPPHNYNYSHSQTSRHQYLPYDANEGRDMAAEYESGHHYSGSIASSRSRGPPPPDVGYRG